MQLKNITKNWRKNLKSKLLQVLIFLIFSSSAFAQEIFGSTIGDLVPAEVEKMYKSGLEYLVKNQQPDGAWGSDYGSREPGVIGLAVLAILAHGEDPNFGPYAVTVKRAVDNILKQQNSSTGMIGSSMYNHGFSTLALAEVYGVLDDDRLGPALEKAVKLLLSSQAQNPYNAWRYSPTGKDADTTAAGACMVALFAARNAGVGVPQASIDKGLEYYKKCQSSDGGFGYTNAGGSNTPRSAIGTLVYALARKKNTQVWKSAFEYIKANKSETDNYHYYYTMYYLPQALFQSDVEEWRNWNIVHIKSIAAKQSSSGSWNGDNGTTFATACALLSLALNYRFLPIYER